MSIVHYFLQWIWKKYGIWVLSGIQVLATKQESKYWRRVGDGKTAKLNRWYNTVNNISVHFTGKSPLPRKISTTFPLMITVCKLLPVSDQPSRMTLQNYRSFLAIDQSTVIWSIVSPSRPLDGSTHVTSRLIYLMIPRYPLKYRPSVNVPGRRGKTVSRRRRTVPDRGGRAGGAARRRAEWRTGRLISVQYIRTGECGQRQR